MAQDRFKRTPFHFLQFVALKIFCKLVQLFPYPCAIWLGKHFIAPVRFLMPKRFARMKRDIQLAFPKKSPSEVHQIAQDSWNNMGVILMETVKLSAMSATDLKKHCRIDGLEKIVQAQDTTGGIIHIGHFTNWESFGLVAPLYGIDKAVLAQRVDNPYVDKEINRMRNIVSGHTFYSNHEDKPFFACMRWLKKKKLLGILFDQNTVTGEMWFSFLGRTAAFSPITALLATKLQIPVFPVNVYREKDGQLISHIFDPILPPKEYSLENVRLFTKTLIGYYEQWIKEDPASWLWAHNRWKREAEGNAYLAKHPEEKL